MEKKAWKWTGKRIALLAAAILIAVFCVWWLRPRSVEELVGVPQEKVAAWEVDEDFADLSGGGQGGPEGLYAFSFNRPSPCDTLIHRGLAYEVHLNLGDRARHFVILEDGTLWDGDWRYALSGGQAARERLAAWLAEQTA